ncbi:MAG: hypothetical protein U0869_05030 [Chloroflexota bacterium]
MSKAGVDQLVRELASAVGIHGIVASVLPCSSSTTAWTSPLGSANPNIKDRMMGGIPIGRMGGRRRSSAPSCSSPRPPRPWSPGQPPGGRRQPRAQRRRHAAGPVDPEPAPSQESTGGREQAAYLVLRDNDIEAFTHPQETVYHSQHILGHETTGGHDLLLNRGTVDPRSALGGGNHPDNDEVYYALSGWSLVDLGGHPGHRRGLRDRTASTRAPRCSCPRARSTACATSPTSRSRCSSAQPAARGANGIHDMRLDLWGTGFKLREGCELVKDDESMRVIEPGAGWDPKVEAGATSVD